jgi:hypothetical protein
MAKEPEHHGKPAPLHETRAEHKPEQKDKPEQLAHGVKTLNSAAVGTVIDSGPATITQILYTTAPSAYEVPTFLPSGLPVTGYLCLLDQGTTPPTVIYNENIHVGGGHSPHASHKVSAYVTNYTGNLYLQSCPVGAAFSITTA